MTPSENQEEPVISPREEALHYGEVCNCKLVREITAAFAHLVDASDSYTNSHSFRVAHYTKLLTIELGYSEEITERYYYAALLHDIGKTTIPKHVLFKNGRLSRQDCQAIREHPIRGYEALKDIRSAPELAQAAAFHHERPDGKGYPYGLRANSIPRVAQIIAVADAFDAMYSDRPYRERMNFEMAVEQIRTGAGTQFFADVVEAFMSIVQKGILRASNDLGGGCTENIDNTRKMTQTA